MAVEDEQQRTKRMAAAAYDYEGDPRWADYWSNVLIPPHMASRSDVVEHYKRKFYKLYIDPDLDVERMSSAGSSQSTKGSSSGAESSTAAQQTSSRNSGGPTAEPRRAPPAANAAPPAANAAPLRFDGQTIQFSINAWVLIVTVLGILPIGSKSLTNKACRLSLLGTACSSVYSLYNVYGKPRAWNMPAIRVYFQSILAAKDFMYFVYCIVFVPFQVIFKFSMLPLLCRALEHDAKFLRRNFSNSSLYRRYLEEICLWVEANTTTLNIFSSNAEIALGFILILSIFSWQRSILLTFIYWHLLKLMYHAPATATYHRSVWVKISRTVMPYIYRYTPFLKTPLSAFQRWWLH